MIHVDIPEALDAEKVLRRIMRRYPTVDWERNGHGYHSGAGGGTTWTGAYRTYRLFDKRRSSGFPTAAVEEAAAAICREVEQRVQMKHLLSWEIQAEAESSALQREYDAWEDEMIRRMVDED